MRAPLEYGDNFPVPSGRWNPSVPWRFPAHEILPRKPGVLGYIVPWITLGVGLTLGVLWMSWRVEPSVTPGSVHGPSPEGRVLAPVLAPSTGPAGIGPAPKPGRTRSALG